MTKTNDIPTASSTTASSTAFTPIAEAPPAQATTPWPQIVEHLEADPGTWYLVAEDVSTSIPHYLRRRYGLTVRTTGNDPKTNRVAKLYAMAEEK